jgi:hypothetical protein
LRSHLAKASQNFSQLEYFSAAVDAVEVAAVTVVTAVAAVVVAIKTNDAKVAKLLSEM